MSVRRRGWGSFGAVKGASRSPSPSAVRHTQHSHSCPCCPSVVGGDSRRRSLHFSRRLADGGGSRQRRATEPQQKKSPLTRSVLPWCVCGGAASRASRRLSRRGCGRLCRPSPCLVRPRPCSPRPSFGRPAAAPLQRRLAAPVRPCGRPFPSASPIEGAVAVSARFPSVARSRCPAGLGGGRRAAASSLSAYAASRDAPRPRQPVRARIERVRPAARIKFVPSSQVGGGSAASRRRRAFLLAEGFCALSRTQCLSPPPLPPPVGRGCAPPSRSCHALPTLSPRSPTARCGRSASAPLASLTGMLAARLPRGRNNQIFGRVHSCLPRDFAPLGYGLFCPLGVRACADAHFTPPLSRRRAGRPSSALRPQLLYFLFLEWREGGVTNVTPFLLKLRNFNISTTQKLQLYIHYTTTYLRPNTNLTPTNAPVYARINARTYIYTDMGEKVAQRGKKIATTAVFFNKNFAGMKKVCIFAAEINQN